MARWHCLLAGMLALGALGSGCAQIDRGTRSQAPPVNHLRLNWRRNRPKTARQMPATRAPLWQQPINQNRPGPTTRVRRRMTAAAIRPPQKRPKTAGMIRKQWPTLKSNFGMPLPENGLNCWPTCMGCTPRPCGRFCCNVAGRSTSSVSKRSPHSEVTVRPIPEMSN